MPAEDVYVACALWALSVWRNNVRCFTICVDIQVSVRGLCLGLEPRLNSVVAEKKGGGGGGINRKEGTAQEKKAVKHTTDKRVSRQTNKQKTHNRIACIWAEKTHAIHTRGKSMK